MSSPGSEPGVGYAGVTWSAVAVMAPIVSYAARSARFDGCVRGTWIRGRVAPEWSAEARISLAQRRLPPEIEVHLASLGRALAPLPHGAEVHALLARHYVAGRPPGAAFAGVLAALFAAEGLVLLDPRTPAMAALAAPVLRFALE